MPWAFVPESRVKKKMLENSLLDLTWPASLANFDPQPISTRTIFHIQTIVVATEKRTEIMTRGMICFVSYRIFFQKRLLSEYKGRLWSLSDWIWHFVMPYLSKQRVARWDMVSYVLLITSFQFFHVPSCISYFWRNLALATLAINKEHSCVVHVLIRFREAPFFKCFVSIWALPK